MISKAQITVADSIKFENIPIVTPNGDFMID
jgi:hypothetical protein